MPKDERPGIRLDDGESNHLTATWSRSWKHLIVAVTPHGKWHEGRQVALDAEQVERLREFLGESLSSRSAASGSSDIANPS
jgi:hypothetical protein